MVNACSAFSFMQKACTAIPLRKATKNPATFIEKALQGLKNKVDFI
jgi:hypothetical protein